MNERPKEKRINDLKASVFAICEQLKGPMSNIERALLVADRKDIRDEITKLEAQP